MFQAGLVAFLPWGKGILITVFILVLVICSNLVKCVDVDSPHFLIIRYMTPLQGVVSMDGTTMPSAALPVYIHVSLNFLWF